MDESGKMKNVIPSVPLLSVKNTSSALVDYRSAALTEHHRSGVRRFLLRGVSMSRYEGHRSIPLDGFFVIDDAAKGSSADRSPPTLQLTSIDIKPYEEQQKHLADEKAAQKRPPLLQSEKQAFVNGKAQTVTIRPKHYWPVLPTALSRWKRGTERKSKSN